MAGNVRGRVDQAMTTKDELLETRFLLNMGRINGLVHLLHSNEALKPTGIFRSEGARADILRLIVVFLHATFEVVLRSHLRKPNTSLSFYSRADLDRALKLSAIDAKPFRALYPPLVQMAKRRNRIVHEADLPKRTDTVSEAWGVVDDWQLVMWLLAVGAFYFQMRMALGAASVVERTMYEKHRQAMAGHVDYAKQLLALAAEPPEGQRAALERISTSLRGITATLEFDDDEILEMWRKTKAPDDGTTEEEARAQIVARRGKAR